MCKRAGKALARLCLCAGSSEPLLVAYAKRTEIRSVAHLFYFIYFQESDDSNTSSNSEKKQRTGWPEHVWASELISSPTHV